MLSRTRRFWRDHIGLPSKPSRGLCQYVALLLKATVLFAKLPEFITFAASEHVSAFTLISISLFEPDTDGLLGGFEFSSEFRDRASVSSQFNDLLFEGERVGRSVSRHDDRLVELKCTIIHQIGATLQVYFEERLRELETKAEKVAADYRPMIQVQVVTLMRDFTHWRDQEAPNVNEEQFDINIDLEAEMAALKRWLSNTTLHSEAV